MRLINVHTLELKEFPDDSLPEYGILSHTWAADARDEITFQEWGTRAAGQKPGYQKIANVCKKAREDMLDYVWCDTVCINKADHGELEYSLNTMFAWYRDSTICYAYLDDVSSLQDLRRSRWLTRGWTLQELVAPGSVVFYDRAWNELGTKRRLQPIVSEVTRIDKRYLSGGAAGLHEAPMGLRISWVTKRTTKFIEDMSYCMLGICGVKIPVHYGEGLGTFARLQRQIMADHTDNSILAWSAPPPNRPSRPPGPWVDALAPSPNAFLGYPTGFSPAPSDDHRKRALFLNKCGLVFDTESLPHSVLNSSTTYAIALLRDVGQSVDRGQVIMIGIVMKWLGEDKGWVRDPQQPGLVRVPIDPKVRNTYDRFYIANLNTPPRTMKKPRNPMARSTGRCTPWCDNPATWLHRMSRTRVRKDVCPHGA